MGKLEFLLKGVALVFFPTQLPKEGRGVLVQEPHGAGGAWNCATSQT